MGHLLFFLSLLSIRSQGFIGWSANSKAFAFCRLPTSRKAKPARLEENVNGVLYVNDRCINCQACAGFAPDTFRRLENKPYHIVHQQPGAPAEIIRAQAALRACPVAAIRLETLAERRHRSSNIEKIQSDWEESGSGVLVQKLSERSIRSFPRPFLEGGVLAPSVSSSEKTTMAIKDVYWTGHHNEASFGAVPYILKGKTRHQDASESSSVWVMVDTPKFSKTAVSDITSVAPTGPDYLFLTHVDDTADHDKWASEFPQMKQVFHEGDLGRYNWIGDESLEVVEILLKKEQSHNSMLNAFSLDGSSIDLKQWLDAKAGDATDLVILHTPGHSYGSISLYRRDGIMFTGDTYAATQLPTSKEVVMTGFGKYGRDLNMQVDTLDKMSKVPYRVIAPGHGLARDYRSNMSLREPELRLAQQDLREIR